jgi:Protein of unknown function DUF262
MSNKSSALADKLFPEVDEFDLEVMNIPPEKRKLNTETYDFTVSTVVDSLKKGTIKIPSFQRGYVWSKTQASRLIESLVINCPIPVIYLSQDSDEVLNVIDGNQRLNAIKLYLNDEFELKGLTAYPELENLKFSELDPRFQRHITNRTLRCIAILKDTHPQIKFDVFERLNTGSVKLNYHELRHGINSGRLMEMIEEIALIPEFRIHTLTKKDKRMKADELVLRFLALSANWRNYTKPLVAFLNKYSESNRNLDEPRLNGLKADFLRTFETAETLLHNLAFKTYDSSFKGAKFNAALYDAQMIALFELNLTSDNIQFLRSIDFRAKNREFIESDAFNKFIDSGTTDKNSVVGRIEGYTLFLKELITNGI